MKQEIGEDKKLVWRGFKQSKNAPFYDGLHQNL